MKAFLNSIKDALDDSSSSSDDDDHGDNEEIPRHRFSFRRKSTPSTSSRKSQQQQQQQQQQLSVERARDSILRLESLSTSASLRDHEAGVVTALKEVAEVVLWGEQNNEADVFNFFAERNTLLLFKTCALTGTPLIQQQVIQTLSILIENIDNTDSLFFLLSNNHVNEIIEVNYSFTQDTDLLPRYISFLKTLAIRLNKQTVQFFFDARKLEFPLLTQALALHDHTDEFVRNSVRNIVVQTVLCPDVALQQYVAELTLPVFFESCAVAARRRSSQMAINAAKLNDFVCHGSVQPTAKPFVQSRRALFAACAELEDLIDFFFDLLNALARDDDPQLSKIHYRASRKFVRFLMAAWLWPQLLLPVLGKKESRDSLPVPVCLFILGYLFHVDSERQTTDHLVKVSFDDILYITPMDSILSDVQNYGPLAPRLKLALTAARDASGQPTSPTKKTVSSRRPPSAVVSPATVGPNQLQQSTGGPAAAATTNAEEGAPGDTDPFVFSFHESVAVDSPSTCLMLLTMVLAAVQDPTIHPRLTDSSVVDYNHMLSALIRFTVESGRLFCLPVRNHLQQQQQTLLYALDPAVALLNLLLQKTGNEAAASLLPDSPPLSLKQILGQDSAPASADEYVRALTIATKQQQDQEQGQKLCLKRCLVPMTAGAMRSTVDQEELPRDDQVQIDVAARFLVAFYFTCRQCYNVWTQLEQWTTINPNDNDNNNDENDQDSRLSSSFTPKTMFKCLSAQPGEQPVETLVTVDSCGLTVHQDSDIELSWLFLELKEGPDQSVYLIHGAADGHFFHSFLFFESSEALAHARSLLTQCKRDYVELKFNKLNQILCL